MSSSAPARDGTAASLANLLLLAIPALAALAFREIAGWDPGRHLSTGVEGELLAPSERSPGLVYAVSAFLDRWARGRLSVRTLVGVPQIRGEADDDALLTDGPYAVVRHPRYLSVMTGITGWALAANHAGGYGVAVVSALALLAISTLEERELVDRFGARYEDYRSRVPRFVPRFPGRGGGEA